MQKLIAKLQILLAVVRFKAPKVTATVDKKLNVLFLVPWYHTNMIPMVDSLQKAGHTVAVGVETESVIENYDLLKPINIHEAGTLQHFRNQLPFNKPDLTIIRSQSKKAIELMKWAKSCGSEAVGYNQKSLRREPGLKHLIRDFKRLRKLQLVGMPLQSITPVDYIDSIKKGWPKRMLCSEFNFPLLLNGRSKRKNESIQIIQVGKLTQPRKRHDWTIQSLLNSKMDCTLKIFGAGPKDFDFKRPADMIDTTRSTEYFEKIHELALVANKSKHLKVEIVHDLDYYEIQGHYLESDICVLPSETEEYGISLLEAMSHGCAVLVSDASGVAHSVQDDNYGMVFSTSSYSDYDRKLLCLMQNKRTLKNAQNHNRRVIQANHNYNQFVAIIENLVN